LRAGAGALWNGNFTIVVEPLIISQPPFTLLVPSNPSRLPITEYYQGIPVSVECNNLPVSCVSGCPINTLPTSDPLYTFWSNAIENLVGAYVLDQVLPTLNNTLSTIVWVTKIPSGNRIGSPLFGLGDQVLMTNSVDDSSYFSPNCILKYERLVDATTGESVTLQTSTITPASNMCDPFVYDKAYQDFNTVLSNLNDDRLETQDTSSTLAYIDLAKTISNGIAWQSCKSLALSLMRQNRTQITEDTLDCFYPEGTPAWKADPCCNAKLLVTMCCRSRQYEFPFVSYHLPEQFDAETELEECIFPKCLIQPLKNLEDVTAYASKSRCLESRKQAIADQDTIISLWDVCHGRIYSVVCSNDNSCSAFDKKSVCIRETVRCTIPCETDQDCFVGSCQEIPEYGKSCVEVPPFLNEEAREEAFFACIMAKVEPHLAISIRLEIEQSSDLHGASLEQQFIQLIKKENCVSTNGYTWTIPLNTQEECEASAGFCPWRYCYIGFDIRHTGDPCSHETCMNEIPADNYCGYRFHPDYGINTIGRPADICQVNIKETGVFEPEHNDTLCYQIGGTTYMGYSASDYRAWGSCRTDDTTRETCIQDFCRDATCASYCRVALTSATCVGTTPGNFTRQFYSWSAQYSTNMASACVVEGADYDSCVLREGGTWVSGRQFLPKYFDTPATCPETLCYNAVTGPIDNITTADACYIKKCTSCTTGTEPSCLSEAACVTTYSCDVTIGCKLPRNINELLGFESGCTWTPESCIIPITEDFCLKVNVALGFQKSLNTSDECLTNLEICNDGTDPTAIIHSPSHLPEGFNLRNRTECEKCDGAMQPYWNWQKAKWFSPNNLISPEWLKKELLYPQWRPVLDRGLFDSFLEKASAHRLASVLVSELYCM